MKRIGTLFLVAAFALPVQAGGDSSDGHTHAAPEPVVTIPMAPRATAATEEFELVGVLEGKHLTLYLDRFATNAPVLNAEIEVESGALKAVAAEVSPGVYRLPAEALAQPGKHPLSVSILAGDAADLMNATLEVGPPGGPTLERAPFPPGWAVWGIAGALLATGAGLAGMRRRKQNRKH